MKKITNEMAEDDEHQHQHNAPHPDRLPLMIKMIQVQDAKIGDLEDKIDTVSDRQAETTKIVVEHRTILKGIGWFVAATGASAIAIFLQFIFDKFIK